MVVLDANVILRYLLNDNEAMAKEAENVIKTEVTMVLYVHYNVRHRTLYVIKTEVTMVPIEVIAEVVYVLKGVYSVDGNKIRDALMEFLSEVTVAEKEVIQVGLDAYAENNLDFVDCILYAYSCVKKYDIKTFDKKLNKLLSR
jgi:predicted nucleic-acid-binding protein